MFGLIGSVKTFSKVLGVGMNVGPYMAYILYKKKIQNKGGLNCTVDHGSCAADALLFGLRPYRFFWDIQ